MDSAPERGLALGKSGVLEAKQSGDKHLEQKNKPGGSWGKKGRNQKWQREGAGGGSERVSVQSSVAMCVPAVGLCTCAGRGVAWGRQDRRHPHGPPEG